MPSLLDVQALGYVAVGCISGYSDQSPMDSIKGPTMLEGIREPKLHLAREISNGF